MTWVLTVGGICALIILHELGHFAAAKAVGMRVERFSLFFPTKLLAITRGETEYSLGALPLGGYVKITGMNPEEITPALKPVAEAVGASRARVELGTGGPRVTMASTAGAWQDVTDRLSPEQLRGAMEDMRRAYVNQAPWRRVVVILAGPAVNLAIALVIFWAVLWSGNLGGAFRLESLSPSIQATVPANTVDAVEAHEPATGVLAPGDRIVAIDGIRGATSRAISLEVGRHLCAGAPAPGCRAATPVALTLLRHGATVNVSVSPQYDAKLKRMRLGFAFGETAKPFGPVRAAGTALHEIWAISKQTVSGLGDALTSSKARHQVTSIVGIAQATSANVGFGAGYALVVLGFVSLALAVLNLFPFLPLDGGHILWAVAEKVRGRRIPAAAMWQFSSVGIVLLVFLVVNGVSNDISRLTGS